MAFVTLGVHFDQNREPTAIATSEIKGRKLAGRYANRFLVLRPQDISPTASESEGMMNVSASRKTM